MEQQDAQQPVFNIEKIYIKDLSVEVPNAPQIFLEQKDPSINIDLATTATPLNDGFYEVVLKATVTSKFDDGRTVFLVEVAQAGIFLIQNIGEEDIQPVLMVGCPNILLPYLRETVSSATNRAGFQPVMLTPVNFEALFMARQQQLAQQAGNA
jgi:preprotein translocase subunit SecB